MEYKFKIGFKLYSTDTALIPDSAKLLKEAFFDYIELYIIPGSFENTITKWKGFECPYVIHAPHSLHGINLARADMRETNQMHFSEAQIFADSLGADIIIIHGGNNGSFDETIRQIAFLNDSRTTLENKPKVGFNNERCVGWSPEEFHRASESGVLQGTVLDFGHAVCAANSSDIDPNFIIGEFMAFKPKVFHISDGKHDSESDVHLNFGKGNFNIKEFLSIVPDDGLLTIETPRAQSRYLNDFIDDVFFLRNIFCQKT